MTDQAQSSSNNTTSSSDTRKKSVAYLKRPTDLNQQQFDEYRQLFLMFDANDDGSVSSEELAVAMRRLNIAINDQELQEIIEEVDQDGNGEIDFYEFCAVIKRAQQDQEPNGAQTQTRDVIGQCFEVFDRANQGQVTFDDFRYVLQTHGGIQDEVLIDELFGEVDVDRNGSISENEFAQFARNYLTDEDLGL